MSQSIRPANAQRRQQLSAVIVAATSLIATFSGVSAHAQEYPSRPINIVVAYPAGGDTDVLARLFGEKLQARLHQTVVVENRTGAGGTIGTAYVARANPDGYTLLLAPNTVVISPLVMKPGSGASYDVKTDLTPIMEIGTQSLYVVAATSTGINSTKELVDAAKAGKITSYASPGQGSPMHILAELFDKSTGTKITQVPYRGSVPAVADMVGGHVPMMYSTIGPVQPFIDSKKLVALAVADPQRTVFMPNVPTLAEQGIKGADVGAWQAFMGPKNMPPELVKKLNAEFNEILKMPDVIAKMNTMAVQPIGGDPSRLAKLLADDQVKYTRIVKEFNIQID